MTKTQKKKNIYLAIVLSVIFVISCLIIVKMNKPSIITPCTFIRTYEVLNVAESSDDSNLYVTIRQYQVDDVETVKIAKSIYNSYIVGNNYEFTFQLRGNVKDNIKNIFSDSKLISVSETSLLGEEQKQDSMCE